MALDPNISLGVRPLQLEMPNQLAQYAQISQIQNAQQANQLNRMQMAEYERARAEEEGTRNFLGTADLTDPKVRAQLLTGYGKAGREIYGKLSEAEKAQSEDAARRTKLAQDTQVLYQNMSGMISNKTDAAKFLQLVVNDPAMKDSPIAKFPLMEQVAKIPEDPQGLDDWKKQFALGATKYITENKPVTFAQDTGGGGRLMTRAGLGGPATVVPGSGYTKTPTFADITSQGQLAVAQQRLAKEGAALDPAENAAISKAIIEGRLDPNRVNGRNAKILATTLLANPDANVLELGVSASGATAAERSLATQTAKMSTAANEANKMVDVVRGLSDKVDRTEFPTINAITNAVSKGTGGKEIVQLNASINALVNSYARAISPTGQPTVSDKNHAREVINSAYSTGQISAILDVMQQEMSIAREAAGTASTELKASRETARGRGAEKPTANATKLAPADQQALDWARSNPNDPRATQIKQRLGAQ
jgi:hypothetical protein